MYRLFALRQTATVGALYFLHLGGLFTEQGLRVQHCTGHVSCFCYVYYFLFFTEVHKR